MDRFAFLIDDTSYIYIFFLSIFIKEKYLITDLGIIDKPRYVFIFVG